jgi:glutamine kinase
VSPIHHVASCTKHDVRLARLLSCERMSKSDALQRLQSSRCGSFIIDPFLHFTRDAWERSRSEILTSIANAALGRRLAVRSSGASEGIQQASHPGEFRSVLDVDSLDPQSLRDAIEQVLASFERSRPTPAGVLVQRFVGPVSLAGVATTLDNSCRPYITIEYDAESGRTDQVTSGHSSRRLVLTPVAGNVPVQWARVRAAVNDIRRVLALNDLVIEFAIDSAGIHVFQAWDRGRQPAISVEDLEHLVRAANQTLQRVRTKNNNLVLSDMSDWNPAEMLGPAPGPLDVSLYAILITNTVWARSRASLGYFRSDGPLLCTVGGKPYVDVARSFRSLTPAALSHDVREEYVRNRLSVLSEDRTLHDKVENAILQTYWPLHPAMARRRFPRNRPLWRNYSEALYALSRRLFGEWNETLGAARVAGTRLRKWRDRNTPSSEHDVSTQELISYIRGAIRICRSRGTLPFAVVARLAFIATGLVRDLAAHGYLGAEDADAVLGSVETPAHMMIRDLSDQAIPLVDIVKVYGHLRPHSYDITSDTYANRPGFLAGLRGRPRTTYSHREIEESDLTNMAEPLKPYFASLRVDVPEAGLLRWLCEAIALRESQKFVFSAILADIIEAFAVLAGRMGLTRSDARQLPVGELLRSASRLSSPRSLLAQHPPVATLSLPDVIGPEDELFAVESVTPRPTFITTQRVTGLTSVVDSASADLGLPDGRIILIEAADPGFDWIFSRPLVGLVTCYGGSSSHMAVRAYEQGIPAAIGCGQPLFDLLRRADTITLDCQNHHIAPNGL